METERLRRCRTARPELESRSRSRTESHWDPWDPVVQARVQQLEAKHWSQLRTEASANYTAKHPTTQRRSETRLDDYYSPRADDGCRKQGQTAEVSDGVTAVRFNPVVHRPKTATPAGQPNCEVPPNTSRHGYAQQREVTFDFVQPTNTAAKLMGRSPHPKSPSWLAKLNTGYNQRARQGFVYWYSPRPKPTLYGRYSIGAKHMQYGLCMAPRS